MVFRAGCAVPAHVGCGGVVVNQRAVNERERDERDLQILRALDEGATRAGVARAYKVSLQYIAKLVRESKE